MISFKGWLIERKKAHYDGKEYDGQNFPQVASRYKDLRNASRPVLQKLAVKRGIDPHEPNNKLTSDILRKELGSDRVDGYYDRKSETNVNRAKMRNAAKKASKPSYQKKEK